MWILIDTFDNEAFTQVVSIKKITNRCPFKSVKTDFKPSLPCTHTQSWERLWEWTLKIISFWKLLWLCQCQSVLASTFPLDNIGGMRKGDMLHGQVSISHKTLQYSKPHKPNILLMGRFQRSCIGNRPPQGQPHLHLKDICKSDMRAMDIKRWVDITNDRLHWRHKLKPRTGARKENTEACCQGEACSKERKRSGNTRGGCLHMHLLQSRLAPIWAYT